MLVGKLWLDQEDDEEEEHWDANVLRAIIRADEIVLEFSGHDPDEGEFSGQCRLAKQGAFYVGVGSFTLLGKTYGASVSATLDSSTAPITLSGTWHDTGSRDAYVLSVELDEFAPN